MRGCIALQRMPAMLALSLLVLLTHISLATAFKGEPVSSRFVQLVHAGVEAPPLELTTSVPLELQYQLNEYDLRWSDLGGTMQRLLLWDLGRVLTASSDIRELRVRCGLGMDDLVVPRAEFQEQRGCPTIPCTGGGSTANVLHATVCADSEVEEVAKCAVVLQDSELETAVDVETSTLWAEEANNTDVPRPTILRYSTQTFAIHLQPPSKAISSLECPERLGLVLPCTTFEDNGEWCTPARTGVVSALLREFRTFLTQQESNAPAEGTTGALGDESVSGVYVALWVVASVLMSVIGSIAAMYLYRRVKRLHEGLSDSAAFADKQSLASHPHTPVDGSCEPHKATNNLDEGSDQGELSMSMLSGLSELENELEAEVRVGEKVSPPTQAAYSDTLGASQVLLLFQIDPVVLDKRVPIMDITSGKMLSRGKATTPTEVLVGHLGSRQVAIKRLRTDRRNDTQAVERIARELRLAATLKHPNILELLGLAWNVFQNLVGVWELCRGGDLRRALRNPRVTQQWTWTRDKLTIATGVLRGLSFLHLQTPSLVHGAIEPRHILLDAESGEAVVCGLSHCAARQSNATGKQCEITAGAASLWVAPEVLSGHQASQKADVYSFGMVLAVLDMGSWSTDVTVAHGNKSFEPQFTKQCPELIRQITRDCLQPDPDARPTAHELVFHLTDLDHVSRPWTSRGQAERQDSGDEEDGFDSARALFCL